MRVFIDANVWINYIWQQKASALKQYTACKKVIDICKEDKNVEILLSPFLIREISSHYRDWFLLQKMIQDGFSYRFFSRKKKNKKYIMLFLNW